MIEITDFNFAEDEFTAADLAKFELLKTEEVGVLNNLAELLNQMVAKKLAKQSQEKDEFYGKQLASKELESDIFYKHFPCGYFSTAENGIINKINDTLLVWLGYAKEDIIGKVTWQSLLSVGGQMYFETHYSPLLQMQGFVQEISFEMVKKDKTRLPILINTKQIRDENGKVQINYSTVFDMSQRKSYEKELLIAKRTAEEQNKLIEYTFRNASIPIYFILEDASFYNFNDIAAENLGYTREEFRTLKLYDLDKVHDEKKLASLWAKLKEEKKITIETQQKKKDGTLIDVIVTANYVKYGDLELSCSYVQDVTEKKKVAEELKLMDFAFKKSATPIMLLLPNGEFYSFNDSLLNLLGYSQEEFCKMNLQDVATEMDEPSCNNQWDEIREKKNAVFNCHFERKDGVLLDVEVSSNLINYNEYEVNFLYIKDVTEKLKADENLKQSNQRYEYATLATSDVIWEADLLKKEAFISKNFTTFFGHPVDEGWTSLENNIWRQNIHPDEIDNVLKSQYEALNSETAINNWTGEYRLRKSDGTYAKVLDRTFGIRNEQGRIVKVVGSIQDITQRKEEEERLRLMEAVILNAKDSVLITEAEPMTGTGPKILFVNPAFEKMTGYSKEELIGKTPKMFQNEYTDRKELEKLSAAMKKWESCEVTLLNSKKNGQNFWVNFAIVPLSDEKGWFTHWIAVERDITKQIEANEEKEKLVKELLENNLELKQFSYITSHNLRAPLTNLVAVCNLLKTDKITDALTLKLIDSFKISTHRLNETLNDLINILIVKEKTNLILEELSVEEIFDIVKESISETLSDKKLIFETDFSEVPTVHFTKVYLESVFFNLITNSIKYRHPERNPIVKIKTIKDSIGRNKLIFSDNGIGMDTSRVKDKIFGFHQRFHYNTDSKGIGLFLIKSQINALGGEIEMDSVVNMGTTFTITFNEPIK
jgi:PAS domain S-box-containing protein